MNNIKLLEKFDIQSGEILEVRTMVDPRATKGAFGYEEYSVKRKCGTCDMYVYGRGCTLVKGDIDPKDGVCIYWSFRDTMPIPDKKYEPMMTQHEAGYIIEKGGTHCASCKHFKEPNKCKMVGKNGDEDINGEYGCCIMWEK